MPAKVIVRKQPAKYIPEKNLKQIESVLKKDLPIGWTYARDQIPIIGRFFWNWRRDGWRLKRPDRAAVGSIKLNGRQILVIGPRQLGELKGFALALANELDDSVYLTMT